MLRLLGIIANGKPDIAAKGDQAKLANRLTHWDCV
jgi:hypothetical protein